MFKREVKPPEERPKPPMAQLPSEKVDIQREAAKTLREVNLQLSLTTQDNPAMPTLLLAKATCLNTLVLLHKT
jgi:hypothetical protein